MFSDFKQVSLKLTAHSSCLNLSTLENSRKNTQGQLVLEFYFICLFFFYCKAYYPAAYKSYPSYIRLCSLTILSTYLQITNTLNTNHSFMKFFHRMWPIIFTYLVYFSCYFYFRAVWKITSLKIQIFYLWSIVTNKNHSTDKVKKWDNSHNYGNNSYIVW